MIMIIISIIHLLNTLSEAMPVALHELFHLMLTTAIGILLILLVF